MKLSFLDLMYEDFVLQCRFKVLHVKLSNNHFIESYTSTYLGTCLHRGIIPLAVTKLQSFRLLSDSSQISARYEATWSTMT